jgi:hypothetical protein
VRPTYPRGTLCFRGREIPITDIQIAEPAPVPCKPPELFAVQFECAMPVDSTAALEFFKYDRWLWWDLSPEEDLEHLCVQFDAWDRWVSKGLRGWRLWNRWGRWV